MNRITLQVAVVSSIVLMAGCVVNEPIGEVAKPPDDGLSDALPLDEAAVAASLGREVALTQRLKEGDEFRSSTRALIRFGQRVFEAAWTPQEGGGRPLSKGNGNPLSDLADPLIFPRNFNRISAMDSNGCSSCHNTPSTGGGGHFTANVFIPAQRFDYVDFNTKESLKNKCAFDERGTAITLKTEGTKTDSVGTSRATLGMYGAGYIEMLSRQMTADLQRIRDSIAAGESKVLTAKGVEFGSLRRNADGSWDTSKVEGLAAVSMRSLAGAAPSLIVRPFHQEGVVISIREFTNNAMNHHHGIQSVERFGANTDPDGDNVTDELNRAEVTATSVYQATLRVPGRVIPRIAAVEKAVLSGEKQFAAIGCDTCHRPSLPLTDNGWVFIEPNPYNPAGNLQPGPGVRDYAVDLSDASLPGYRLKPNAKGVVLVPAYTDLKKHNITTGPNDPNCEPVDMQHPPMVDGRPNDAFFAGNCAFLTKKLWGAANEPPYFHHGKFTTLREAILAHAGEAAKEANAFRTLSTADQAAVIEFLKTLQVMPESAKSPAVDSAGNAREWPPTKG